MRTTLAAVLLSLLVAAPAAAQTQTETVFDEAAQELRSDSVFVHPEANPSISSDTADELRQKINDSGEPIFIAVFPPSAIDDVGGNANDLPRAVRDAVGLSGTYGVVAARSFRAASDDRADADSLATAAVRQNASRGLDAILTAWVEGMTTGGGSGSGSGGSGVGTIGRDAGEETSGAGGLACLGILGLGGVAAFIATRRRKKQQQAAIVARREGLRPYLQMLADDVLALEHEVTLKPDARDEYDAAINRMRAASAGLDMVKTSADLDRVERVISEGNYAMARCRAVLEGREPPAPPPDLAGPGRQNEPPVIIQDGRPTYGYGGGWYGGGGWFDGGGLLTGILIGGMLGGGGGGFGGWGGGYNDHGGGHDSGGWGDSGGGGFDVGGGDFGGDFGDVGGGDF
jgi:hypothetical protein